MGKLHVWMPLVLTGTGSEVWTRRLAELLQGRGHTVTLDPIPHKFQYAPWLAPVRCPADADVTIANSWNAAAFQKGPPVVSATHLVVHDPALSPYKSIPQAAFHRLFVRPMERAALKSAANVAVSQKVADQMKSAFDASPVVIPNGVDPDFYRPGEAEHIGPLRLLFVGKPSARKGFDLVTEIVRRLGETVEFTCVGELPSEDRPLGTYTGPLDREGVRAEYQRADLLLFPSRMEGFGLVAAEALSCGLPVLASRNTAVDEVVPDDCGIIEAANDVEAFVRRLSQTDRASLKAMGQRGRKHALSNLSEAVWLDRMELLLEQHAR